MRTIKLTLQAALACVLTWCLVVGGCSYPDDENWEALRSGIGSLPPPSLLEAKRWTASENAYHALSKQRRDEDLLSVTCFDSAISTKDTMDVGGGDIAHITFTVQEMISCIVDIGERKVVTFSECVKILTDGARDRLETVRGRKYDCTARVLPPFTERARDPQWDPDNIADEDISEMLVAAPELPYWLPFAIIGGVVIILVAPELLPALCVLRAERGHSCPSSPLYPPGQTPQPNDGDAR